MALSPRIDISETDTEAKIEAELPGINEKDVEVVLGHGRLTIKGEKKQQKEEKKKDYHMVERSYGVVRPFDRAAVRGGSESSGGGVRQRRADRHRAQAARGQSQGEEDPGR